MENQTARTGSPTRCLWDAAVVPGRPYIKNASHLGSDPGASYFPSFWRNGANAVPSRERGPAFVKTTHDSMTGKVLSRPTTRGYHPRPAFTHDASCPRGRGHAGGLVPHTRVSYGSPVRRRTLAQDEAKSSLAHRSRPTGHHRPCGGQS